MEDTDNKSHPSQQLSTKIVYENPWINVREDHVVRPDGSAGIYSVLATASPSVYIIALTDEQEIYFVKQFRYPLQKETIELPCGQIDQDEPLVGAQRELQEETGLIAHDWTKLGVLDTAAGIASVVAHVYLARDLEATASNKQNEDGITEVQKIPLAECLQMIKRGELQDAQSIASLLMVQFQL